MKLFLFFCLENVLPADRFDDYVQTRIAVPVFADEDETSIKSDQYETTEEDSETIPNGSNIFDAKS